MAKQIELNSYQCKEIVDAIFEDFDNQEKFYERARKVFNSNKPHLIYEFLDKYFKNDDYWFKKVPNDFFGMVIEKMQKGIPIRSFGEHFAQLAILSAINKPEKLNEIFGPIDVCRLKDNLNCFSKMDGWRADRNAMMVMIGALIKRIEKSKPDDAEFNNIASMARSAMVNMIEGYPLLDKANLFNCDFIDSEKIVNDCLKFAENAFDINKYDGSKLGWEQKLAFEIINGLLYRMTVTDLTVYRDATNLNPCAPFYRSDAELDPKSSKPYLDKIVSELRNEKKFPRAMFEPVLREYDRQNRKHYYNFATPDVLKEEFDKWVNYLKSTPKICDSENMWQQLSFILRHIRNNADKFTSNDLVEFAKVDYNNCYTYANALIEKEARGQAFKDIKEKAILNLAVISGKHGEICATALLRDAFVATKTYSPAEMNEVIAADAKYNTMDWVLRFKFNDAILDKNAQESYVLLRNIFDACDMYPTKKKNPDKVLKDLYNHVKLDIAPQFKTYIALMLNDEELLNKCFSNLTRDYARKLCNSFEEFTKADIARMDKMDSTKKKPTVTKGAYYERLKASHALALKTDNSIDNIKYGEFKNENQPKLKGEALDEFLSRM